MATGPDPAFTSMTVPGLDGDTAASRIMAHLDTERGVCARSLGDGRILVTQTRRPRWALVACIATVWLGGLGLLFLLIRRTEAAEIGVRAGPHGCTVTLPPLLTAVEFADIGRLLRPDESPSVPTADFEAIADLDARTIPR